jgi:carbamate kinase
MRLLVAIGGNALTEAVTQDAGQLDQTKINSVARALVELEKQHTIVVTHGNGPQVGWLAMQEIDANMPLDMLDAQSEGLLGYRLAQAMDNFRNISRTVSLLTRVEVTPQDPALAEPTKPVGPILDTKQASYLADRYGWQFIDVTNGKRRVVASPKPIQVQESHAIEGLIQLGYTVICAGGGGIPVVQADDRTYHGISGVIDKDYTSALLACELNLDALILLTDVDAVYSDWGKTSAKPIRRASCNKLSGTALMRGSMGPKVRRPASLSKPRVNLPVSGNLPRCMPCYRVTVAPVLSPNRTY